MKASFVFPAVDNYASQKSGILKGEKERQSDWGSWWNQPGVAPCSDGHRQRQLWKWNGPGTGSPRTEKVATVLLLDEDVRHNLDWKTYFRRVPHSIQEPDTLVAKGAPPAPPLTQEEMQAMCDIDRLVQKVDYKHQDRSHREYRQMKALARRRIFTQSLVEAAGVHYCFSILHKHSLFDLFTGIVMNSSLLFLCCFSGFVFGEQTCSCVVVCV